MDVVHKVASGWMFWAWTDKWFRSFIAFRPHICDTWWLYPLGGHPTYNLLRINVLCQHWRMCLFVNFVFFDFYRFWSGKPLLFLRFSVVVLPILISYVEFSKEFLRRVWQVRIFFFLKTHQTTLALKTIFICIFSGALNFPGLFQSNSRQSQKQTKTV